ncbi:MAG TPA: cytochrome P450 [Acidimicrobiia bacterium]|nr:cytochrome P450 [Acidimicrobiia bacterium]
MTTTHYPVDFSKPGTFVRDDYYGLLGALRARPDLPEYEPGSRLIARYADIREISRDPARFCSGRGVLVNDPLREGGSIEGSILHLDPPRHGEYRRLLNREFTPRAVGKMEDRVRERTRSLLDAIPRGEIVDAVDVLAAPLPVMVIADVLGVPETERSEFRRWSDATILASDGRSALPPDAMQSVMELHAFLQTHAERQRADPGDDVVSLLVRSEIEGAPLSAGELVTFNLSLLVAGNETTRHLISGALLALAEHPDQRARLAAEPDAIPGAIEECLRWVTPIQQFGRTVVEDTTVGGVDVRADEFLLMLYASGNRDEAAFGPTADTFDAFRPATTPNLAFGFGEHLCLGAALARLEGRVLLEELLDRAPDYQITGPGRLARSSLVRGHEHLPIRLP